MACLKYNKVIWCCGKTLAAILSDAMLQKFYSVSLAAAGAAEVKKLPISALEGFPAGYCEK